MTAFVRQLRHEFMPHPDGHGRLARIVIDVDLNAVHDYVMHRAEAVNTPWPAKLIEEMVSHLTALAQHENMVMEMLRQ